MSITQLVTRFSLSRIARNFRVVVLLYSSFILISAVIFSLVEKGRSIWDGLWWAFITGLTIGYGDVYPTTVVGRLAGIVLAHMVILIIAPMIVSHVMLRLLINADKFTNGEQEEIKLKLAEVQGNLELVLARLGVAGYDPAHLEALTLFQDRAAPRPRLALRVLIRVANSWKAVVGLYAGAILGGGIIFHLEEAGRSLWDGIWWAVVTGLTIGYGDIYPTTPTGRVTGILLAHLVILIIVPMIIAHMTLRLLEDSDAFTNEEQIQVMTGLAHAQGNLRLVMEQLRIPAVHQQHY